MFRGADAFRFLTMPPQAGTQIFALASAIGASVDSSFFYAKVKGELERDVREIGFRSLTSTSGSWREIAIALKLPDEITSWIVGYAEVIAGPDLCGGGTFQVLRTLQKRRSL